MEQKQTIENAIIVGGGTAGWLAAAMLSSYCPEINFKVIEPIDSKIIGVGEGSWPSLTKELMALQINPEALGITMKIGVEYLDWGGQEEILSNRYFHPFLLRKPIRRIGISSSHSIEWQNFNHYWTVNHPYDIWKQAASKKKARSLGVHVNTQRLAWALKARALLNENCKLLSATVKKVNVENNNIISVETESGSVVTGDYWIDATGFKKILASNLKIEEQDFSDRIKVDTAITVNVQSEEENNAAWTQALAMPAGWAWKIATKGNISYGYVYSSKYTSDRKARKLLKEISNTKIKPHKIKWKPKIVTKPYQPNCTLVGLSCGFLEPLEAMSSQMMMKNIKITVKLLKQKAKSHQAFEEIQQKANERWLPWVNKAAAYIAFHYAVSKREGKFWQDYRDFANEYEEMLEIAQLAAFRKHEDALFKGAPFSVASWQVVLAGAEAVR